MQAHEQTAISMALYNPKVWEQFVDEVYSIFKRTHFENVFLPSHQQSSSKY